MVERRLPSVLVVDDTEANRYAVGRTLRAAGFETSEASTGRQAIQMAYSNPDVIVLDVNLPDMNGFDVVRQLRANPTTAAIPILHLSASYMRNEDRAFGLENGANAYLTHPIEPPVFVATIRSLLRVRQIEAERQAAASEWQATFDAISEAVCVIDSGGAVTRANRAATREYQKSGEEIIGKQWVALLCAAYPGIDDRPLTESITRREPVVRETRAGKRWLRIALDPLAKRPGYDGTLVCVVSDISERKTAEDERAALLQLAERARLEAESGNRAKSEFLATMSHEIRTPINAILGYAQILDMGLAGSVSAEQRSQLDRLRRSAAHLLRLVNEVLDLANVDAGRMRVEREQGSADDLIEDALAIGRPMALARGITIDTPPAERVFFVADPGRVRQVLVNLLSNAVKFSAPGGRISLTCSLQTPPHGSTLATDRPYATVCVQDAGVGVAPRQLAEIFEPFVQGETGPTRTFGGSGLGLTISRRLARLMGGDITVASAPGKGSSFTLWLPASEDQSFVRTSEHAGPRRRDAGFDPTMFGQLGRIASIEALSVGHAVAVHLRTDSAFPPAGNLNDSQLVDHIPALVVDLGLALTIVSEVGMEASMLLQDGSAIRNEIAERHGAQRRRIGWSAEHVRREYRLLADELGRLLRSRVGEDAQGLDGALDLIERLLDQSVVASVRGHRQAGETED